MLSSSIQWRLIRVYPFYFMSLKNTIEDAVKAAMKNKEPELVMTLRMLLAAVKNREIEKRAHPVRSQSPLAAADSPMASRTSNGARGEELSDEEVLAVVRSEVKKRKDAIAEFGKAGREDLVKKESAELAILEKYLPAEISDEEIEKLLAPLAQGASASDFGRVMGAAMKAVSGRASGDRVSVAVKRMLQAPTS